MLYNYNSVTMLSRIEKLINRFLSKPKDLTWGKLITVLRFYGFEELSAGKTGGSRRKFADKNKDIISLHKPLPKNIVRYSSEKL
ncbi:hypothetical protein [Pedobacter sp. MR22-3]|uniref:hypothetical protein n=1 Tax=Pedobacter sp. MR22-3 TaxID=2994552 RepID=UPI002246A3FB|nr:hypothetical protein [Pedobacter sp. MR22-3]MCX2583678.1 hypothetical protein [Pedobacter sp. MR22-3]